MLEERDSLFFACQLSLRCRLFHWLWLIWLLFLFFLLFLFLFCFFFDLLPFFSCFLSCCLLRFLLGVFLKLLSCFCFLLLSLQLLLLSLLCLLGFEFLAF